jgi:hypothetical protein
MKSSPFKFAIITSLYLLGSMSALAARVDMTDPRRALAREDDVRIDAQLLQQELSSSSPLTVTWQIQNFSALPVAVADKTTDIDYDPDTSTIIFSIGAEIPEGATMPHLVVIHPGEKRVFASGGHVHFVTPSVRTPWTLVPHYVQVKVVILRNLTRFASLIEAQMKTSVQPPLPNEMFDPWVESSDAVFLNPIPVRWNVAPSRGVTAESPAAEAGGGGL